MKLAPSLLAADFGSLRAEAKQVEPFAAYFHICVVGQPWEILKIEQTGEYHGLYHVLNGLISAMDEVSASDLSIDALVTRIRREKTREIILALEPKLEGEITGMHILSLVKPLGVKVCQIAQGIPVGRDLEFADEVTLGRALRGRIEL